MSGLQTAHSSVIGDAMGLATQPFVDESTAVLTAVNGTPGTGQFRSTITGRAPITDISADLKVSLGVERVPIQSIYILPNEFGPANELVWGALNDSRGLVRFVGNWSSVISGEAAQIRSGGVNDYIEIVFYGTGLNLLVALWPIALDMRVGIDGGTSSTNIWPGTPSGVLTGQKYSPNQILSAVQGLTLGIHTAKIYFASHPNYLPLHGFEVINTNTTGLSNINPGAGYVKGQKFKNNYLDSIAYDKNQAGTTVVTGTRGGRIVRYLSSDDTVGTAWRAVDAAAAYMSSADHTNEEVARTYHFREFGAGRTSNDDFSTAMSASERAFILEDGATMLVTNSGTDGCPNADAFIVSTYTGYWVFNFVGTGLDVTICSHNGSTGNTSTYTFYVDGVSVYSNVVAITPYRKILKIASGLPYGTHTVKLLNGSAGGVGDAAFSKFIVYQPKKPTLPSGVLEIADYNVVGAFTATVTDYTSPLMPNPGTIRKMIAREACYVGSWTYEKSVGRPSPMDTYSTTNGNTCWYTFWGTGVGLRCLSASNAAESVLVELNPNDGTGWKTLNTTNYGSVATNAASNFSGPGDTSFNASTGAIDLNSSTYATSVCVPIYGLSLGMWSVRMTNQTGASYYLITPTFDVITPIHAYKNNLYADLQNSLPIGSCSLMDSRSVSPMANTPGTKAWAQAYGIGTCTNSISSGQATPLPGLSTTIMVNTGTALDISYRALITHTSTGAWIVMWIWVDGSPVQDYVYAHEFTANYNLVICDRMIVPVGRGVHKVDVYWVSSGATVGATARYLTVKEI